MLFVSAAVVGGILLAYEARPTRLIELGTFAFARAATYEVMNFYAMKMAGVFMITGSTLVIRIGFSPRWIAILGYACVLLLVSSGRDITWIWPVFPLWVLLISISILIDNLRRPDASLTSR